VQPQEAALRVVDLELARHDLGWCGAVQARLECRPQPRHKVPQLLARELGAAHAEQARGGGVAILDLAGVADDEHAFLDRVEDGLEQAALAREPLDKDVQVDLVGWSVC
jgi:hypothetical protein